MKSILLLGGGKIGSVVADLLAHATSSGQPDYQVTVADRSEALLAGLPRHPQIDTRVLDVNDAAILHYGHSRDEFLGMTIRELHDAGSAAGHEKLDYKGSAQHPEHYLHQKKNGEMIDVHIHTNDIDFDGKHARLVIANDVTQKLHAEKAILSSERRFKTLVQESGDLITILDADGKIHHTVRPVSAVCMCGGSAIKPWCDGTHRLIAAKARDDETGG